MLDKYSLGVYNADRKGDERMENTCPCGRKTERSAAQKKALMNRLKRIEGQIRGLEAMLENDAYCNDILQQSAAAGAAINAFNRELLGNHIRGCVVEDLHAGRDEIVDELIATVQKLMK